MRIYPEEALIEHDEACDVQHPIRIDVMQLHPPLIQQAEQEQVRRVPEAALVECKKAHDLADWDADPRAPQGEPSSAPPHSVVAILSLRDPPVVKPPRSMASSTTSRLGNRRRNGFSLPSLSLSLFLLRHNRGGEGEAQSRLENEGDEGWQW
jgi:hypothetical protein